MGFGKRLRKRVSRARRAITSPVRKALTPIVGKKAADLLSNPGGAVVSKLHRVTSAYGKVLGTVYGVGFGGIIGARAVANKPYLGGKTGAAIGRAAIQIEKPLAGLAGGLIAGGLGSSNAGGAAGAIAGDESGGFPSGGGRGFDSFVGADSSPSAPAPTRGGTNTTLFIVLGLGAVAVVGVLLAFTKRRK